MHRRNFVKATAISIALATAGFSSLPAVAADTIKVGKVEKIEFLGGEIDPQVNRRVQVANLGSAE